MRFWYFLSIYNRIGLEIDILNIMIFICLLLNPCLIARLHAIFSLPRFSILNDLPAALSELVLLVLPSRASLRLLLLVLLILLLTRSLRAVARAATLIARFAARSVSACLCASSSAAIALALGCRALTACGTCAR